MQEPNDVVRNRSRLTSIAFNLQLRDRLRHKLAYLWFRMRPKRADVIAGTHQPSLWGGYWGVRLLRILRLKKAKITDSHG